MKITSAKCGRSSFMIPMNQRLATYLDFDYVCNSSYSRYSGNQFMFSDKHQVPQAISDLIKYYLEHKKVAAKEVNVFYKRLVGNKPTTVHCTNIKEIPDFC